TICPRDWSSDVCSSDLLSTNSRRAGHDHHCHTRPRMSNEHQRCEPSQPRATPWEPSQKNDEALKGRPMMEPPFQGFDRLISDDQIGRASCRETGYSAGG